MREVSRAAYLWLHHGEAGKDAGGPRPVPPSSFLFFQTINVLKVVILNPIKTNSAVLFSVSGADGHQGAPVPDSSKLALDGAATRNKKVGFCSSCSSGPSGRSAYVPVEAEQVTLVKRDVFL